MGQISIAKSKCWKFVLCFVRLSSGGPEIEDQVSSRSISRWAAFGPVIDSLKERSYSELGSIVNT